MSSNAQKTHATKNGDGALKVVATYAIFSSLWILFSDAVVVFLFQDREVMTLVNTLKGWLFVAVTSLLLYAVVRGLIREAVEYSEREEVAARERERTALLLEAIIDGSGDAVFAKATGLTLDLNGKGLGLRSNRYSMLVRNGKVEQLNVEAPGKFEVSDADTLLRQLKAN